jgi:hypothetical protein
MKEVFQVIQ